MMAVGRERPWGGVQYDRGEWKGYGGRGVGRIGGVK